MKKTILYLTLLLTATNYFGQDSVIMSSNEYMINGAKKGLMLGSYGEVSYNQQFDNDIRYQGKLDVPRIVLMMGYKFNEKITFITEMEYEHVKEIYVEQAFVNYKLNNKLNFKAGLMLIPMSIINELHEPTTYFMVNRPYTDKYIIPSTWREIGLGVSGILFQKNIKYDLYLINGLLSYNNKALFTEDGFRNARQKGSESIINSPNVTGKLAYFGLKNLNIVGSFLLGKTSSSLVNASEKNDLERKKTIDSTRLGLALLGMGIDYSIKHLKLRAQFNYNILTNTTEYNEYTKSMLGKRMFGYYFEAGYDFIMKGNQKITPFVNYTVLDPRSSYYIINEYVDIDFINTLRRYTTIGVNYKPVSDMVFKLEYQKSNMVNNNRHYINAGIGYWFK